MIPDIHNFTRTEFSPYITVTIYRLLLLAKNP